MIWQEVFLPIFKVVTTSGWIARVHESNYTKFGEDIGQSSARENVLDFKCNAWLLNTERLKADWGLKSRPNFGLFEPCKNYGRIVEIPESIIHVRLRIFNLRYEQYLMGGDSADWASRGPLNKCSVTTEGEGLLYTSGGLIISSCNVFKGMQQKSLWFALMNRIKPNNSDYFTLLFFVKRMCLYFMFFFIQHICLITVTWWG